MGDLYDLASRALEEMRQRDTETPKDPDPGPRHDAETADQPTPGSDHPGDPPEPSEGAS